MDRPAEVITSKLLLRSGGLKNVLQLYLLYGGVLLGCSFSQ